MKSGFLVPRVRRCVAVLIVLGCMVFCRALIAQSLTPEQVERILQELKTIETEVDGNRTTSRANAVGAFVKGAASDKAALELYLACYKEVHFDRQDARGSDYREWRGRNEELVKERGTLAALRLQLQYLVLTLKAAQNVSLETIIPELESFAASVVSNLELLTGDKAGGTASTGTGRAGGRTHGGGGGGGGGAGAADGLKRLREPVNNSIFALAFNLDKNLKVADWSMTPGNIGSIYEKAVFPFYQKSAPESLPAAWDRRIKLETDFMAVSAAENPTALETFKTETLPQMNFEKSRDLFRFVSQQQGALAIISLLKANQSHPRASEWLQEFRQMLRDVVNPSSAAPAPTGSPQ